MSESTSQSEATQLENTTYNILGSSWKRRRLSVFYNWYNTLKTPKCETDQFVKYMEHNKIRKTNTFADVRRFGEGSKGTKVEIGGR